MSRFSNFTSLAEVILREFGPVTMNYIEAAYPIKTYNIGVSCVCGRCESVFVGQGEFAVPQMGLGLELDQVMGIGPHLCESCRLDIPFPTVEELKEQAESYEECLF